MRSAPVGCTAAGLILGTVFINPPRRLARDTSLLADLSIGDHLTPSHDIRVVDALQFLRRAGARRNAETDEPFAHLWRLERLGDLPIEPQHNVARRLGRHDEAVPGYQCEAGDAAFGDGRNAGQERQRFVRRYAERTQVPRLNLA